jgi:hypothetical protein
MAGIILTVPTIKYRGYFLLTSLMDPTVENAVRQNFFRQPQAAPTEVVDAVLLSLQRIRILD